MVKEHKKPNIIYILADDLGYGDISTYNKRCPFRTPHLDELCHRGMRFTDAHATSAVCTPSRYGILTGRYNWRSRLKSHVIGGYSEPLIEENRQTVADLLKTQGYQTAIIGKWHLGMQFAKTTAFREADDFAACEGVDYNGEIRRSPIANGFDYYFGISGSLDMPPYLYIENDHFTETPERLTSGEGKQFWRKGPTGKHFRHEHVLDELTEKVCIKISEYKAVPFFLYFPMPAPHTPILPDERFQGKSNTNAYGDFVLHCDDVVGRIVERLKEENIYENTIVIFTSDNGCSPMADYQELSVCGHNPSYIFRGAKADIYEGGHRIPLIVQWPQVISGGRICSSIVCLSDFMATVSDILGVTLPDDMGEDSVSNKPLWLDIGNQEVREDIVHQSIDGSLSIRRGRFKLELCPGSGGWSDPVPGSEDPLKPRFQLYDLEEDIAEQTNIITRYQELAAALTEQLRTYIENGRSTPGARQSNNGQRIWETIMWLDENDPILF